MLLFMYRCPITGREAQGFSADDVSEDHRVYEPVTCPVCHTAHHVNPTTATSWESWSPDWSAVAGS